MKSNVKTIVLTIILTVIASVVYLFIRPRFYEQTYLERIEGKTREIITIIEKTDLKKELNQIDIQKIFENQAKKLVPIEYLAIFDTLSGKFSSISLDKESELFYSISHDIQSSKLQPTEKPMVRFHKQKKYYVFLKQIPGGLCAVGYRFEPTRRDIIQLALEILLIIVLSIFIATVFHLYRYRTGKIPADVHVIKIKKDTSSFIRDLDTKKNELSILATNRLKEYVLNLFNKISSEHAPDSLAIYLMNRESTHMSKTFEMKGKSFITIDSPDLDIIKTQTEIGKELQNSSVLVLSNGMRLLIPILYRNTLLGALNITRGVPFKGLEIQDIRKSFGELAQYLSEYIVYHDAVIDSTTGFYTNFYFNFKYEEFRKNLTKSNHFSVLEIAFTKENCSVENAKAIAKAISHKFFQKIDQSAIPSLFDEKLRVLLPLCDKENAIQIAQKILSLLQGTAVHIPKGKVVLAPTIGLASTSMPGCEDNPIAIACENLHYALSTGKSDIEYARITTI